MLKPFDKDMLGSTPDSMPKRRQSSNYEDVYLGTPERDHLHGRSTQLTESHVDHLKIPVANVDQI